MNESQITEFMMSTTKEIAALWESTKSSHHRISENDKITAGIHELAKNIATMAMEIKLLTERVDNNIERIEMGQKTQGERIGNIEKIILSIERNEKEIARQAQKLETIEKEPAAKWKAFVAQIISLVVAAVVGLLLSKLM